MARNLIFSFLFLAFSSGSYARFGSQMFSDPTPSSIMELLKPAINNDGFCPRRDVIYHDHTFALAYHAHQPVATPTTLQTFKGSLSFFLEKDLHSGSKLKLMLDSTGIMPRCTYLSRRVADSIPFSSDHFDDILSEFSIDPNSADATAIKNTIDLCESPAMKGETKTCTTSLEAMVEFSTANMGMGAMALATKMEADPSKLRAYTMGRVELKSLNYMSCHRLSYPYAVHYCHYMNPGVTAVLEATLVRDDGAVEEALVVCHRETSDWRPDFFAFERLNVKPGQEPICHLFPKGHLLWIAPHDEAHIKQVVM